MNKKELKKDESVYCKGVVIAYGNTAYKLCHYIIYKQRLYLKLFKGDDENVMNVLYKKLYTTFDEFKDEYNLNTKDVVENHEFKVFIIRDADTFKNDKDKNGYLSKEAMKKHWCYKYIKPIINYENLESIIMECNINYKLKMKGNKEKEYMRIFPLKNKLTDDLNYIEEIEIVQIKIEKNSETNLNEFLDYCLSISK